MRKQLPLSDIFAGIAFAAILLAIYFSYIRFFADCGFASVYWAMAACALFVAVSVYFGTKIDNLVVCLYAVTAFWMSIILYDVVELELTRWEIWRFARNASVFAASHLVLQLLVWTITHGKKT